MMPLRSLLFSGNGRLEACLVQDFAHISIGDTGPHVQLIHDALRAIDGLDVASDEIANMQYGRTTAAAVLAYKRKRKIINRNYQSTEDDIVGKMTIKSMDDELFRLQSQPSQTDKRFGTCNNNEPPLVVQLTPPAPPIGGKIG
jgi:hypothetical protein